MPARGPAAAALAGAYNRSLIEASLDPLVAIGPDGKLTDVNAATEAITGCTRAELVGTDFSDYFTEPVKARDGYERAFRDGVVRDYPLEVRHKDGRTTPVLYNASVYRDAAGSVGGVFAAARDVTRLKRAEAELRRTNRALRATTACNQAILHAADEAELLGRACDAIVAEGGYRMAWIGYAENDRQKTVRPMAVAGCDYGYVASAQVTWADTERGQGPTGRAIRNRRPEVCRDMLRDPRFGPWREAAQQRGFASSIVLPLLHDNHAFGSLSIYAAEADAFSEAETRWLLELGEDIAFGIRAFRNRLERERSVLELRRLQQILNQTQAVSRVGGWEFDTATRRLTWTDEVYRLHGVDRASFNPEVDSAVRFYSPGDRDRINEAFGRAVLHGVPYDLELQLITLQHERIWVRTIGETEIRDDKVIRVFGNIVDITERKRAEEQLQKLTSELEQRVVDRTRELNQRMAELQTIFETVPIGLAIADSADGTHIRGNPENERMLGVEPGGEFSVTGRSRATFRVYSDGKELPPEALPMQRAARGETVCAQRIDVVRADGRVVHLISNATPLYDDSGCPRGAIGAFLDISALKRTEEALRESERRFRNIYDSAPVSIWLEDWTEVIRAIELVRASGVTDWPGYFRDNPEFVREALDAVKILDVNQWSLEMFEAHDKAQLLASLQTVFASPEVLRGFAGELVALAQGETTYRAELALTTATGKEIHGLLAMTFPREAGQGDVLVTVVDITKRKQTEKALEETLAKAEAGDRLLDTLMKYVPEGIAILDAPDARIRIISDQGQQMMGGRLQGQNASDAAVQWRFYRSDGASIGPADLPALRALERGEVISNREIVQVMADGRRLELLCNAAPICNSAGDREGAIVVWRDITTMKAREAEVRALNLQVTQRAIELESANRELESFAYSVSHDLRAPLRSIDGFSQILVRNELDRLTEKGRENLLRIRAAAQRMGTLIDGVLQLSRTARADLRRVPLDLSAIARSIAEELSTAEPARTVNWTIAPSLPAAGDPVLIRAALDNLIRNAWKFTSRRDDAGIEIGSEPRGGECVYYVRDNGAGFDMNYADKLFGAFQRLHSNEEFPGTGIGLATVQRIIRRHGGQIWAEAQVKLGATFYFTLPTVVAHP